MRNFTNLVRVGVVSHVDSGKKAARVYYPQFNNLVSGWLPVLQHPATVWTSTDEKHDHSVSCGEWLPKVNDIVLVLYTPGFSTDGYILGVIQKG